MVIRRKHIDLPEALQAISDRTVPVKDAVTMYRKAERRAEKRKHQPRPEKDEVK